MTKRELNKVQKMEGTKLSSLFQYASLLNLIFGPNIENECVGVQDEVNHG